MTAGTDQRALLGHLDTVNAYLHDLIILDLQFARHKLPNRQRRYRQLPGHRLLRKRKHIEIVAAPGDAAMLSKLSSETT